VSACLFVTGSGTDVGKTFISALLVRALRARGVDVAVRKPVITGFDPANVDESDTARLLRACDHEPSPVLVDVVSPLRFTAPLSPDMAARREARAVSFDDVVRASIDARAALTVTEGVGGVMVPARRHAHRSRLDHNPACADAPGRGERARARSRRR
jgi:dethiobiotin synthetase